MQGALKSLRHLCRGVLALPFAGTWAGYKALTGLAAGSTATEGYFSSRTLQKGVLVWSREIGFDAVFAFSSGMAPLALQVEAKRRVLCMDDLDSRKWTDLAAQARWPMRVIYRTEAARLAVREHEWIAAFDATLMVSRREADLVAETDLRARVHVIPPVLPGMVKQADPAEQYAPVLPPREPAGVRCVGFVGAMDYAPNVDAACWFAREIWPRIRRQCPDAQFWIVGRSPARAIQELARPDEIIVTGSVPDVDPYVERMHVHVAPMRVSRGVQMKVLAAMAAGRPCVVTSCVADGLDARPGRDLIAADSPAVIAQQVIHLLDDPEAAQALGRAGRSFLRRIDPQRIMQRIETLLSPEEQGPQHRDIDLCSTGTFRGILDRELVSSVV